VTDAEDVPQHDHPRTTDLHECARMLALMTDRVYWGVDIIPLDIVPQPGMEGYDLAAGVPESVVDQAVRLLALMDGEAVYRIRAVAHVLYEVTQGLADAAQEASE